MTILLNGTNLLVKSSFKKYVLKKRTKLCTVLFKDDNLNNPRPSRVGDTRKHSMFTKSINAPVLEIFSLTSMSIPFFFA